MVKNNADAKNVLQNWEKRKKTLEKSTSKGYFDFFDCNAGAYLYCG